MVMEILLSGDLVLRQYHDVEAVNLKRPNGLIETEAWYITDVVGPEG